METLLHIAYLVLKVSSDVALLTRILSRALAIYPEAGGHIFVQEGGIFLHGITPAQDGGQDLVVYFY